MFRWFRRPAKSELPIVAALRPDDLVCPFAFPIVATRKGEVEVHRSISSLGLIYEKSAVRGEVPPIDIFTASGETWRPVRIRTAAHTGRKMFGRAIVHAAFEYEQVGSFGLEELRAAAHAAVEHDPDDLWNQVMSHDDVLEAIDAASTFGDLVRALNAAHGLSE